MQSNGNSRANGRGLPTEQPTRLKLKTPLKTLISGCWQRNSVSLDYSTHESEAEKAARTAREVTLLKDELLLQLLKGLKPLLANGSIQKLIEMVLDMIQSETFQKLLNSMSRLLDLILSVVQMIAGYVKPVATRLVDGASNTVDRIVNFFSGDDEDEPKCWSVWTRLMQMAELLQVPSVFGEAGAEMAIPLTNEREGRAQQLAAYVTNTFNMSGNGNKLSIAFIRTQFKRMGL